MKCNIISGLTKLFINAVLVLCVAGSIVFTACKKEENHIPEAKLEVSPTFGDAPLLVTIKVTGSDLDGVDDIKEYRLGINSEVIKSNTPINIARTFDNEGTIKIYGEVVDSKDASDKTDFSSVQIFSGPFVMQTVSIINDVEIKYTATLSKVSKAELKIRKGGILFLTEEVKDNVEVGTDYEKTFSFVSNGVTKGDYEFVLKSGDLEKKSTITIPNFTPTLNISDIKLDFNEDSIISITLPTPLDRNPEDNPVQIKSVKSFDGKTQLTINGYKLGIKALPNQTGNYQVEVEYGSAIGGIEKAILQGNIIKHTWKFLVNPFVQPNDTTKPIIWNNFSTVGERNAYFDDRFYNYDKTDTITYVPNQFVCTDFASILAINMNGYNGLPLDPNGLYVNNWHNIPMYTVTLMRIGDFHQICGTIMGEYVSSFSDWRFVSPQTDSTYSLSKFNDMGVYKIVINYTFTKDNEVQGIHMDSIPMLEFIPDGSGGWKDSGYRNTYIKLIEKRTK
jgi:hypothetical protein